MRDNISYNTAMSGLFFICYSYYFLRVYEVMLTMDQIKYKIKIDISKQ